MNDPIRFSGRMLSFSILTLMSNDLMLIRQSLKDKLGSAHEQIPVVLDSTVAQDLPKLLVIIRDAGLHPVAVVNGVLTEQAGLFKLAVFPKSMKVNKVAASATELPRSSASADTPNHKDTANAKTVRTDASYADSAYADKNTSAKDTAPNTEQNTKPNTEQNTATSSATHTTPNIAPDTALNTKPNTKPSTAQSPALISPTQDAKVTLTHKHATKKDIQTNQTLVHEGVLRSGQSVSNLHGDLIVVNGVNNGSEAIATGSLHVYGKAQGRLVAGATGSESAMIFCQHLDPSLISIAGVFCLPDGIPEELIGHPVFIKYEKDSGLVFTPMNPALQ